MRSITKSTSLQGHIEKVKGGLGLIQPHGQLVANPRQNQGLQGPDISRPGGRMRPEEGLPPEQVGTSFSVWLVLPFWVMSSQLEPGWASLCDLPSPHLQPQGEMGEPVIPILETPFSRETPLKQQDHPPTAQTLEESCGLQHRAHPNEVFLPRPSCWGSRLPLF